MSILTQDDWHLLTRGSHFITLSSLVVDFEHTRQHEVAGWGGGTFVHRDGRKGWYQTTAKGYGWSEGIVMHNAKPDDFEHFITWTTLKTWVRSLPAEQTEQIKALLVESREIQRDYPKVYPGIGRAYAWDRRPRGTDEEVEADRAALAEAHAKRDIEVAAWQIRRDEHTAKVVAFWATLAPTLLDDMVLAQR